MAMIDLQNVTKLYGTVIGVNDISLSLEPGTYGLLGPNGSGKTTLINLILGQLRPTIGSVRLFGQNPWTRSRLLRQIGLCPAIEVNYPRVTAFEWVKFLLRMHGFTMADAHQRAARALERVKLEHAMHRPMRQYSLGMRQRAKIAQAIAHDPDLLILDEPFNGLDPIGRHEMTNFLNEWAAQGHSLILASHILHEVEAVNPSFLLISGGRLLASGSPTEVHNILANSPSTLEMKTSDPKRLSGLLLEHCPIESIELDDDGQTIRVATLSTARVHDALPELLGDSGVTVYDMNVTDDSLKTLFSTLMQIHRGETRRGSV